MKRQTMTELFEELFQVLLDYAWKILFCIWLVKGIL